MRALRHRVWLRRNRAAAAVLVPSEATRADVLETGTLEASRVHVVPNGFDPEPWAAVRSTDDGPDLVMVGTGAGDGRKKGLDVLFDALTSLALRGLRTVIVGRTTRVLPPGVETRERLDDASLRALVASARLLVHPARSEGFGYPPLEAMAVGVPSLVADGGALPEVVGDAELVVPAGDAAKLAEGIVRGLEDDALRSRLVEAGRRRARAFPPEASARRLLDVLEGI
jgi:glycosyltransferase involved in cell wall biosynthesis